MENNKITEIIKKESNERNNMLDELEKTMFDHNKKIRECEDKLKKLDILKMKCENLERENKELLTSYQEKFVQKEELIENLQTEVQILRKSILNYKSKVKSLQSIIGLMVNDFGVDQVALASGISTDKITEYLKEQI